MKNEFAVDVWTGGQWTEFGKAVSIGAQRLLRGERVTASKIRLRITKAAASPCISEFSLFVELL